MGEGSATRRAVPPCLGGLCAWTLEVKLRAHNDPPTRYCPRANRSASIGGNPESRTRCCAPFKS